MGSHISLPSWPCPRGDLAVGSDTPGGTWRSVMHLIPETVSGPSARFRRRRRVGPTTYGARVWHHPEPGMTTLLRLALGQLRPGRLASGHRGRSGFRRPGPGLVDDRREQHDLDGAAEEVVVPLADRPSDDGEGIHDAQGDVGDPANPWSQDE